MKGEALHAWLLQQCPAYAALGTERQRALLREVMAEEAAHLKSERKTMLALLAAAVVVSLALLPFTGEFPVGSILLGLAFMGFGVSRYRVASRVELRVREAARVRANRILADLKQGS